MLLQFFWVELITDIKQFLFERFREVFELAATKKES